MNNDQEKDHAYKPPPSGARLLQVIETCLQHAGDGTKDNPYREITQYWSTEGHLLAQVDHRNPQVTKLVLTGEM